MSLKEAIKEADREAEFAKHTTYVYEISEGDYLAVGTKLSERLNKMGKKLMYEANNNKTL